MPSPLKVQGYASSPGLLLPHFKPRVGSQTFASWGNLREAHTPQGPRGVVRGYDTETSMPQRGAMCVQRFDDSQFCNSHYVSHFAAFFIVVRAKISIAESYNFITKFIVWQFLAHSQVWLEGGWLWVCLVCGWVYWFRI